MCRMWVQRGALSALLRACFGIFLLVRFGFVNLHSSTCTHRSVIPPTLSLSLGSLSEWLRCTMSCRKRTRNRKEKKNEKKKKREKRKKDGKCLQKHMELVNSPDAIRAHSYILYCSVQFKKIHLNHLNNLKRGASAKRAISFFATLFGGMTITRRPAIRTHTRPQYTTHWFSPADKFI